MEKCDTDTLYDVIIIGTGAAGYSAALYTGRYNLKTLILGKDDGGMTAWAHEIENYPGIEMMKGYELMQCFRKHAEKFNAEVKIATVIKVEKRDDGIYQVYDDRQGCFTAKTIILCTGTTRRKLHVPGEEELFGRGVSYCTTCDGYFFKNKVVTIVGGGDSALTGALYIANITQKTYIIHRRDEFRAEPVTVQKVLEHENIEVIYNNNVTEILGNGKLEKLKLSAPFKESDYLETDGVFVEIGANPSNDLLEGLDIETNDGGFIPVKKDQSTNLEGFFAAGDITTASNHFHQTITAAAEGVIAADGVFNFLNT